MYKKTLSPKEMKIEMSCKKKRKKNGKNLHCILSVVIKKKLVSRKCLCLSAERQKGRETSRRRSPLDLIIDPFRRKSSFTERKEASAGRLFRPSESGDGKSEGIPEVRETESGEEKDGVRPGAGKNIGVYVDNISVVSGVEMNHVFLILKSI